MTDPFARWRLYTQARIGLKTAGHALATEDILQFQLACAEARDAVWRPWRPDALKAKLEGRGEKVLVKRSEVSTRQEYLQRPDLGRRLKEDTRSAGAPTELAFVVSDGLSSRAVDDHFDKFWQIFKPRLRSNLSYGELILVPFARVALADDVGAARQAALSVIFLGERPGLSSPDSLGIYLTYHPRRGRHDAERNCISNVREPGGLTYEEAADKLIFLIEESLRLKVSGVTLKEDAPVRFKAETLVKKLTPG